MNNSGTIDWCLACRILSGNIQPIGGLIYSNEHWTINHVMPPVQILGYLVLQPRRHIESLHELNPAESTSLGHMLTRIDRALRQVTGAEKVYVALFAESAECPHIHFHIIPRRPGLNSIGPEIFGYHAPAPIPDDAVVACVDELRRLLC